MRHRALIFALALLTLSLLLMACAGGDGGETSAPATTAPAATTAPVAGLTSATPSATSAVPAATTAAPVTTFPADPPIVGGIKRADGIVIDGVLDEAYAHSVSIGTAYQDPAYTSDPALIVDPTEALAMKTIYQGSAVAERPNTYFTLHFLWGEEGGEPYLYIAAVIHDETIHLRSGEYMSHPNPWLSDAIELSYHLGGEGIPTLPSGEDTYPTYHNVLVDAREKAVSDHSADAPNHTAVAAQRSYYFDKIETATTRPDDVTYVVEMKIPAYTEGHTGKAGVDLARQGGEALEPGDLVLICVELLDLTYLPEGYDDTLPSGDKHKDEWSYSPLGDWARFENDLMPYMYCGGNRNAAYLRTEGVMPVAFRLSAEWAE